MNYREVPEDKILRLEPTPGFKGWKHFFTEKSISHPAKMNLNLLRWIISTYTESADVVLDPMAGTGSTIILASTMGRHGIAIEYESKFCEMIEENIQRALNQHTFTKKGEMACVRGDARELSKYLIKSDIIISSPPYGNRLSDVAIQDDDPARMGYRQAIDVVLMSPPYESSIAAQDENWLNKHWNDESDSSKHKTMRFGKSMVGYSKPDAIVMSPPYEKTEPMHDKEWFLKHRDEFGGGGVCGEYSPSENNIGNLRGESYFEAMNQVYQECYTTLKPHGKMILVVKNFIRDKEIVRLDLDTIRICESVGFKLIDRWYLELSTQSFWKILYHKNYPNVPQVKYEDVLVFEKNRNSLRTTSEKVSDKPEILLSDTLLGSQVIENGATPITN